MSHPPKELVMITVHPQYLTDEQNRRKAVVIPFAEWERILAALEELDAVQAYDKVKTGKQEAVPFEQAVREIEEGYKG